MKSQHQGTTILDLNLLVARTAPISEGDDKCEACGKDVATRECAHGILCVGCDEAVHGEIDGSCELEGWVK